MEITYFGHSCFLIQVNDHKVLFDPFITPNSLAQNIDINNIKTDFILLTHGHEDHVADMETIYKNTRATLVSGYEVINWFQAKGIENAHPMNHGGSWQFDFGRVKMVNAVHSSSMPDGSYGGNPAGYVIETSEKTFYYAGDTALHQDMRQIGDEFNIDFAILPIGSNFTMDIKDAVKAAEYVNTNKIIGMHYDTFPYIEIDHEQAKKVASNAGKELFLMEIGEKDNY